MAIIHLVRHGSHAELGAVLSGRSPIALDTRGRDQAARLATRFAEIRPAVVIASPLPRATQTAEPIAAASGVAVETDRAFDEVDFGLWTGRTFDGLSADPEWKRWHEARGSARPPEGETIAAVAERAFGRLEALARAWEGALVVVSHGDVIRAAIAHVLGLSLDRIADFDVDPASVSRLSMGAWGGRVLSINECWT